MITENSSEGRHSRESSKSGQHSRQSSRDKGNHSRQNSRELLVNTPAVVDKPATKSIEIYATLPKKKTLRNKASAVNVIEDAEYMLYDKPTQRTGLFGRTKRCDDDKKDKKRARSEERNKNTSKDFSIAPNRSSVSPKISKADKSKEVPSSDANSAKVQANNNQGSGDQKQSKKQHKIRRKLLMGGLIRRKNRSMPDLRDGQDGQPATNNPATTALPKQSVDDSNVGLKGNDLSQSLSGYLSEGHLEFASNGSSSNPNLERSRLMRKSFHGSAGKVLHVAKVPPPPPLRTTSQLSKSKCSGEVRSEQQGDAQNASQEQNNYWSHTGLTNQSSRASSYAEYSSEPQSLPFLPSSYNVDKNQNQIGQNNYNKPRIQDDVVQYANGILYEPTYVVTRADIHNEHTPPKLQQQLQQQQQETLPPYPENGNVSHSRQASEEFPPPPYPLTPVSGSHSRQPSEEFPPPPPPIDETANRCNEGNKVQGQTIEAQQINSLLAQLQMKRDKLLTAENLDETRSQPTNEEEDKMCGETWLRELQAKQAERKMKKNEDCKLRHPQMVQQIQPSTIVRKPTESMDDAEGMEQQGRDVPDCPRMVSSSVKDMAARFEQIKMLPPAKQPESEVKSYPQKPQPADLITELTMQEGINHHSQEEIPKPDGLTVMNSSFESNSSQNTFISLPPSQNICGLQENSLNAALMSMSLTLPHENGLPIDYPEDDISEVAMQNTIQNTSILPNEDDLNPKKQKRRLGKKKSVSFCDQVVLVATAEDDEKDSYIPNPILERVLRSAMNKPETVQVLCEIRSLQEAEMNRENNVPMKFQQHTLPLKSEANSIPATPFQDQLRSVNPVLNPNFARQNSSDSIQKHNPYNNNNDNQEVQRETRTSTSYSPQLQQQIRYTQNGYPQFASPYSQMQIRNQNIPVSQTQKPASPYPTQMQNQYPQNNVLVKANGQKNGYSNYYRVEQQQNYMNKVQVSAPPNVMNQRIQGHAASPITVQQQPNNYPQNQNYQYATSQNQTAQNSYPSYSYQTVPYQVRPNHPLPQYQPPPQPANYQQGPPNGAMVNGYQIQRQNQKPDGALIPNQPYPNGVPNGKVPTGVKYPAYQHLPITTQTKQMHFQPQKQTATPGGQPIMQKVAPKVAPCNLCRKKQVTEPAIYCVDCDFYMSRFRPKNQQQVQLE